MYSSHSFLLHFELFGYPAYEKFKYSCYINIYKMKEQKLLHSPTLESVLMVEGLIEKYSGEFGKYQLWKKLPRKMMYQTFQVILNYLVQSNKIVISGDGAVTWIWNPGLIRKLEKERLLLN